MGFAIRIAADAKKNFKIPMLISGDTHHYSRYGAADGVQFVTSGGGGAFLHPTHQLEPTVSVSWQGQKQLDLATHAAVDELCTSEPTCYPSQQTSRNLTWRNVAFALTNWDFSLFLAVAYTIFGIAVMTWDRWDTYVIITALFAWAFFSYAFDQEKSRANKVKISSTLHTLAHSSAVIISARYFYELNEAYPILGGHWYSIWIWLIIVLVEMGAIGFFVGGTIYGLHLLITCRWFRMNRNDAFSSFRHAGYNNFLRIKIMGDTAEVFAVGLNQVPERSGWVSNPRATKNAKRLDKRDPLQSRWLPRKPLRPHLIERFVVGQNRALDEKATP